MIVSDTRVKSDEYQDRLNKIENDQFREMRISFIENLEQYLTTVGDKADKEFIKKMERLIFESKDMIEFRDNL